MFQEHRPIPQDGIVCSVWRNPNVFQWRVLCRAPRCAPGRIARPGVERARTGVGRPEQIGPNGRSPCNVRGRLRDDAPNAMGTNRPADAVTYAVFFGSACACASLCAERRSDRRSERSEHPTRYYKPRRRAAARHRQGLECRCREQTRRRDDDCRQRSSATAGRWIVDLCLELAGFRSTGLCLRHAIQSWPRLRPADKGGEAGGHDDCRHGILDGRRGSSIMLEFTVSRRGTSGHAV